MQKAASIMAPKQIFVNLPVSDVEASTKFYTAIGATKNPQFSDNTTSCMVFSETINVMIMVRSGSTILPILDSFMSRRRTICPYARH